MSERKQQQQQSRKNPPQPIDEGWSWFILAGKKLLVSYSLIMKHNHSTMCQERDLYLQQKKNNNNICIESYKINFFMVRSFKVNIRILFFLIVLCSCIAGDIPVGRRCEGFWGTICGAED